MIKAVRQSAWSQAQIAAAAGISQEHLSRILQRPRNVEIDTVSRILFAACGAALTVDLSFPDAASDGRSLSRSRGSGAV